MVLVELKNRQNFNFNLTYFDDAGYRKIKSAFLVNENRKRQSAEVFPGRSPWIITPSLGISG